MSSTDINLNEFTTIQPGLETKINSIFDFSPEALGQLKLWIEQSGLVLPITSFTGAGTMDWTPDWTAAVTNPSYGNGKWSVSRYSRYGKTIFFQTYFEAGSTTTFGSGAYGFSLPAPASSVHVGSCAGYGFLYDASADYVYSTVAQIFPSSSVVRLLVTGSVGAYLVGSGNPFTFASGDVIAFSGSYEIEA